MLRFILPLKSINTQIQNGTQNSHTSYVYGRIVRSVGQACLSVYQKGCQYFDSPDGHQRLREMRLYLGRIQSVSWTVIGAMMAHWEIPKRFRFVVDLIPWDLDRRRLRALAVLSVAFTITFLSLLLALKIATQANPAMARSDAWFDMFTTKRTEPYTLRPESNIWTPPAWYPNEQQHDLWSYRSCLKMHLTFDHD